MTVHENQSSGAENLVLFAGRKMASENPKNSGTIRIWSNDATDMLIELRSEENNNNNNNNDNGICSGISTRWLFIHCLQIELEFRSVDFCGGRKTGEPGEKLSE